MPRKMLDRCSAFQKCCLPASVRCWVARFFAVWRFVLWRVLQPSRIDGSCGGGYYSLHGLAVRAVAGITVFAGGYICAAPVVVAFAG